MRNSLNVVLPVTANFIDPLELALIKAARLSGKGCGIRRTVYGCERVTGHRINLAPGNRLVRDCNLFQTASKGGGLYWTLGSDQPWAAVASLRKRQAVRRGKDKVL